MRKNVALGEVAQRMRHMLIMQKACCGGVAHGGSVL
jgi:hypothetical protein